MTINEALQLITPATKASIMTDVFVTQGLKGAEAQAEIESQVWDEVASL